MSKKQSNPPPPAGAVKPPPPTSPPPRTDTAGRVYVLGKPLGIPVLHNHDPAAVIGSFDVLANGKVVGTFKPGAVTLEALLVLSGGYRVLEFEVREGVRYVLRAELLCLSDVLNYKPKGNPQP